MARFTRRASNQPCEPTRGNNGDNTHKEQDVKGLRVSHGSKRGVTDRAVRARGNSHGGRDELFAVRYYNATTFRTFIARGGLWSLLG